MNIEPQILQYLYSNMDIGVLVHDREFTVKYGNSAAEKLIGISMEKLKTLKFNEVPIEYFHEDNTPMTPRELTIYKAMTNNEVVSNQVLKFKVLNSDHKGWVNASSFPIKLENTTGVLLTTFYDISAKKEAELKVKENEKFLQLILDSIPQFIFWKDRKMVYRGCNKAFAVAAGVGTPQNIVGKDDYDLAWERPEADAFRKDDTEVMESGLSKLHIIEPQHQADAGDRWLDTNKIPLFDDNGKVNGILGTFGDVTELIEAKKQVEHMLKDENERLEQQVKERTKELESTLDELINKEKLASLGGLVAGVAHEINTPLGVSITASSYLEDLNTTAYKALTSGNFGKQQLVEYMKSIDETTTIINNNLYRAAELVKGFKEISVNHSNETAARFDLRHYTHSVILTLRHEYKNSPITIQLLPEEPVWITSFPSAFSQILTNLIMNALIHAFTNDKPGIINIELKKNDNYITIVFSDNGKGISKEHVSKIFDPFFTTNRLNGGTGLGLNISYNIVTDKLKGTITCESEPGIGTKFTINIPVGEKNE